MAGSVFADVVLPNVYCGCMIYEDEVMVQLVREVDIGEQETIFELMVRVSPVAKGEASSTRRSPDVILPPH